jgi:hypothetical protein
MQELTNKELEFLKDKEFLLTKSKINEKTHEMMESLENDIRVHVNAISFRFPKGTLLKSGKFSKGENYKGLPYRVLDYPRLFTQKSTFSCRHILWWGNEFSTTLHIAGEAKVHFAPKFLANFNALKSQDFYLCVSNEPWRHEFEPENYKHISEVDKDWYETYLEGIDFMKMSNKLPLDEYKQMGDFAMSNMKKFFSYLIT